MIALLDTTVLLDFIGRKGPERHAAEHVISAAADNQFEPVVALQSLQEILNVRRRRGLDASSTADYVRWIKKSIRTLGHHADDLEVILELVTGNPDVDPSDALIYASGVRAGADFIVTRDRAFGRAVGKPWIDPTDSASLELLVGS